MFEGNPHSNRVLIQDSLNAAMADKEKDVGKEKLTLSSSEEDRTQSCCPVPPICDSFGEKG